MTVPELIVVEDADSLTAVAVARWVAACHHAVARRGRFAVALAGGGTPLPVYRRLAERADVPWERVVVGWGDERFVEPADPRRNEHAARTALLDHVPVPEEAVLGWGWRAPAETLATAYEATLVATLGDPPRFDLVLLGLGSDGHTASLWPGRAALGSERFAAATTAPDGEVRLTLTPRAIAAADEILVLVQGAEKREALARSRTALARSDDGDREASPLATLRTRGRLVLLADVAASGPADRPGVER